MTGSTSEIVFEALPVDDPQVRQPDITRARQVLGWEPEVQLEEGLRRMLRRTAASPSVSDRRWVLAATLAAAAGLCVPAAGWACRGDRGAGHADRRLRRGRDLLRRPPARSSTRYKELHVGVLRVNLYWGGKLGVAKSRPFQASDPRDAAYDWSLYDRTAFYAAANGIKLLFSITGTPRWANGGQTLEPAARRATRCLRDFAYAAAARYSGHVHRRRRPHAARPCASGRRGTSRTTRRSSGRSSSSAAAKWVIQSAISYAKICNAVYHGVHATLLQGRAGRLRRDRAAREQQPEQRPPVGLAGRLPDGGEEGGDEDVRRVRAQPVLRLADRDADDEAAGDADRARCRPRSRSGTSTC